MKSINQKKMSFNRKFKNPPSSSEVFLIDNAKFINDCLNVNDSRTMLKLAPGLCSSVNEYRTMLKCERLHDHAQVCTLTI